MLTTEIANTPRSSPISTICVGSSTGLYDLDCTCLISGLHSFSVEKVSCEHNVLAREIWSWLWSSRFLQQFLIDFLIVVYVKVAGFRQAEMKAADSRWWSLSREQNRFFWYRRLELHYWHPILVKASKSSVASFTLKYDNIMKFVPNRVKTQTTPTTCTLSFWDWKTDILHSLRVEAYSMLIWFGGTIENNGAILA